MAIEKNEISNVVEQSMLDYAVSVIKGRAIPDVRDGLKPIHRRILYAMKELGMDKNQFKAARAVGHIIGVYSPHGDSAAYEAAIRMSQDFINRIPLVNGQGNVGSINDPKSFAAMRYVEMKLARFANDVFFEDMSYNCVDMIPNFDGTTVEPVVLPARIPYYLLCSNIGIAVGFVAGSNPYNLKEVCNLTYKFVESKNSKETLTDDEILKILKGNDFPTGGIIIERSGVEKGILTGQSTIKVRAKYHIDEDVIHITEIPYSISKNSLIESISEASKPSKDANNKEISSKITEISSIKDLTSTKGMDIQIRCKKGCNPEVLMNKLFKFTNCQVNLKNIQEAIVDGVPKTLSVLEILENWYDFRVETMTRKYEFQKKQCEDRLHILEGFRKIFNDVEKAISIIKKSEDKAKARQALEKAFGIDNVQSEYVVNLQVYKFSKSEILKTDEEIDDLKKKIKFYNAILKDRTVLNAKIMAEVEEISSKYAKQSDRKTEILNVYESSEMEEDDIVEVTDNAIYLTKRGYIKRIIDKDSSQRVQGRGGKGRKFSGKDDDFVVQSFTCSSHDDLFFITDKGKVYCRKAFKIPEGKIDTLGVNVATILNLKDDEKVSTVFFIPKGKKDYHIITLTRNGLVKKTSFKEEYGSVGRESGIIACRLREDDKVVFAKAVPDNIEANLMVFTTDGKAITFGVEQIPLVGRTTFGANSHKNNSKVVSAELLTEEDYNDDVPVLILNKNGNGKRTRVGEFRVCKRNTKGVTAIELGKNEEVASVCKAPDDTETCVVSNSNIIRMETKSIRIVKRPTKGYRVMKLEKGQTVVSVNVI